MSRGHNRVTVRGATQDLPPDLPHRRVTTVRPDSLGGGLWAWETPGVTVPPTDTEKIPQGRCRGSVYSRDQE